MRIPKGAPVPFWLGVRQRFPVLNKVKKPPLGTTAVIGTAALTLFAVFGVCIYPKMNNAYYKQMQSEKRPLIGATREELAQGLPVWSDPFDRK